MATLGRVLVVSLALAACKRSSSASSEAGAPSASASVSVGNLPAETREPTGPSAKGATVALAAGNVPLGSLPGDDGRDPTREPLRYTAAFQAFSIDALPFPNDPTSAVRRVATREEAETTCSDAGGRLCTAAEWEYACAGATGQTYATGATARACTEDSSCVASTGARALGVEPEWVAGDVLKVSNGRAARCAARDTGSASSLRDRGERADAGRAQASAEYAFRCCHGAVNDPPRPAIVDFAPFERATLGAQALATILGAFPEVARIGLDQIKFFDPNETGTVISKGRKASEKDKSEPRSTDGFVFTTEPLYWSPEPGARYLIATGRGKNGAFVVALHVLPDGTYRLASSFVFMGDFAPVALAYSNERRRDLSWSTCWGCVGENGGVALRDDHHVVIVQN